jgi:hypothetical protein
MHRNSEHYPDPTFGGAYDSIRQMEKAFCTGKKYIPWVYIASPYRGDVKTNTENAKRYSFFAVMQGKVPFCPHIYFTQFLDDNVKVERKIGLNLALHMLRRCREVWVFGDTVSEGMRNEIRIAKKRHIPVRYFTSECVEVNRR